MAKQGYVKPSLEKLETLYESLKRRPVLQVGVFASKDARKSGDSTNATLAAIHELGAPEHGLPARSILKTPLHDHASDIMAPIKGKASQLLEKGGVELLYNSVGAACIKVIEQAFATGGFGKWAPLKYSTMLAKLRGSLSKRKQQIAKVYTGEHGMGILIDTGSLRRAFSYRLVMKI